MNSWAPLAPAKPGSSSKNNAATSWSSVLKPSKPSARGTAHGPLIGRFPESIFLQIVQYLPVPDLPSVARCNRALARLVRDESNWEGRCKYLGLDIGRNPHIDSCMVTDISIDQKLVRESLDAPRVAHGLERPAPTALAAPPKRSTAVDDFGDFSSTQGGFEDVDFGDFSSGSAAQASTTSKMGEMSLLDFDDVPLPSRPIVPNGNTRTTGFFAFNPPPTTATAGARFNSKDKPEPYYLAYKAHHLSLIPLCRHLRSSPSPSSTLGLLFPSHTITLAAQSDILLSLLLFLSPRLQPLRDWGFLRQALLAAADRFDSSCLVAFEVSDSKGKEDDMRLAAESSWKVWDAGGGGRDQWECGRVWVEKREVFYETGKWDALENIG